MEEQSIGRDCRGLWLKLALKCGSNGAEEGQIDFVGDLTLMAIGDVKSAIERTCKIPRQRALRWRKPAGESEQIRLY